MALITKPEDQSKLAKNGSTYSCGVHFAPARKSGFNMCLHAGNCIRPCLDEAGRGVYSNVQEARIKRAVLYKTNPTEFFRLFNKEAASIAKRCERAGIESSFRILTGDPPWWRIPDWLSATNRFTHRYQYTKYYFDCLRQATHGSYNDVRLVFSVDGPDDYLASFNLLHAGGSVAAVVAPDSKMWQAVGDVYSVAGTHVSVIDGDVNDKRWEDPSPSLVLLRPKGPAKRDDSGFVLRWI